MTISDTIAEPAGQVPIVGRADLVVVGGGPAGIAAAVAGARSGLSVTLLERYPYLGGLASGGMVLVLDDMCNGAEISVRGLCSEMVERMERMDLCVVPPESERRSDGALWRKWSRWGVFDFHSHVKPQPICYAAAFDPGRLSSARPTRWSERRKSMSGSTAGFRAHLNRGWKHRYASSAQSKSGRQAIMGKIVLDATGDLDVAASAGAPFTHGSYMVTTVFRLGGVNVDAAELVRIRRARRLPGDRSRSKEDHRRLMGQVVAQARPCLGIAWCNCPHMTGLDGTDIEDLTWPDFEGRERIAALVPYVREKLPGFEQGVRRRRGYRRSGVRQTRAVGRRLCGDQGRRDGQRTAFPPTASPAAAITTPSIARVAAAQCWAVAGRCFAALFRHLAGATQFARDPTVDMAMGEAAGAAAALSLAANVGVDKIDVANLQACAYARKAASIRATAFAANAQLTIAAE